MLIYLWLLIHDYYQTIIVLSGNSLLILTTYSLSQLEAISQSSCSLMISEAALLYLYPLSADNDKDFCANLKSEDIELTVKRNL